MQVILNPDTPDDIILSLKNFGYEILTIPKYQNLDDNISGHPDLQIFHINNKIFCHKHINKNFIRKIDKSKEIISCNDEIKMEYPDDIPFNVACTGKIAFHLKEKTSSKIVQYLIKLNIPLINVNQGYTKCSTLIIDENNIITADKKIHQTAIDNNINSLLISPGHIDLPGYKYGFIGGSSGVKENSVYFTGNIKNHPESTEIENFIHKCKKNIICLSNNKLIDLGTLFFL